MSFFGIYHFKLKICLQPETDCILLNAEFTVSIPNCLADECTKSNIFKHIPFKLRCNNETVIIQIAKSQNTAGKNIRQWVHAHGKNKFCMRL